ncbi:MAG: PAS domain-containing protein [Sporomusaceae bacterium]|nr:PAS domain-containing protein [Sporomusaceae bacterium]
MHDFINVFVNQVMNALDEGVYFVDSKKTILYWNSGAEAITGYGQEEASGRDCCRLLGRTGLNGEPLCGQHCPGCQTLTRDQPQEAVLEIRHKEGYPLPVRVKTFPVHTSDGRLLGYIELLSDHIRQKIGQDKVGALTKAAYIDSLSELFSKQYIESRLQAMLEAPNRDQFGLIYLNIVDFRRINEMHGVSRANTALKETAKILAAAISSPHIIGRWHGASFIVIAQTASKNLLLLLADRLKALIAENQIRIGDDVIVLQLSAGTAMAQAYDTPDYMIERATRAAQAEKDSSQAVEPVRQAAAQAQNRFYSLRSRR